MGVTTTLLIFGAKATAIQAVIGNLIFLGVSTAITTALAPKPDLTGIGGNLTNKIDPLAAGELVYGQIRKGGTKIYHETTSDNKYYHMFLAMAAHEVEEIGDIYVNDEVATLDGSGYVTSGGWGSKVLIKKFTGADNQNIYNSLSSLTNGPSEITSTFKGQGVACLYVRMEYDSDVFANGQPNITAVVKGRKLYDPRKDSTHSSYDSSLGVSSHRSGNYSTWQYSSNPALALADYLTSDKGCNALQSEIDYDMVATAADDCATTGIAAGVENSFEIDGYIKCSESKKNNINSIARTMNGSLFFGQGQFRIIAGALRAPEANTNFTLDDVRSPISIQTRHSRRDLVNTIRGTFTDKENRWIANEFAEVQLADLSEDNNEESVLDLPLPLVSKPAAAQRLAKQILYTNREQIVVSLKMSSVAYKLQVGDTITLEMDRYGWNAPNKQFVVRSWKASGGDGSPIVVDLTLQETSSTAYQWNVTAEEYSAMISNNTNLDKATENLSISGFNSTSPAPEVTPDGRASGVMSNSWTAASNALVGSYEFGWKISSASEYNLRTVAGTSIRVDQLEVGTVYDTRVRAVTIRGNKGAYSYSSVTITTDTVVPTMPSNLSVSADQRTFTLNWTNPSDADFSHVEIHEVYTNSTPPYVHYGFVGTSKNEIWVKGGYGELQSSAFKILSVDVFNNKSALTSAVTDTTLGTVRGLQGPEGSRGAGQFRIDSDPLPTASNVNQVFTDEVGSPIDKDQAWFSDDDGRQSVWIYDGSAWSEQTAVIDGSLIVSETITASALDVTDLSAVSANLGNVTIKDTLQLKAGGAGFLGGRVDNSAFADDGFYIARTNKGNVTAGSFVSGQDYTITSIGSTDFTAIGAASNTVGEDFKSTGAGSGSGTADNIGFEVSHTSVANSKLTGVIHKDTEGLHILNPTFYMGGSSTGGSNLQVASSTVGPIDIQSGVIDITLQGAGGGGGYGVANYSHDVAPIASQTGGNSTLKLYHTSVSAANQIGDTIIALGGGGGYSSANNSAAGRPFNPYGTDGAASIYGAGGTRGGGGEAAGGDAPTTSYGAGGGGGGGDSSSGWFSTSGAGGYGGLAGQNVTQTIDVSAYTGADFYIVYTQGAGGIGNIAGIDGGDGAAGIMSYSSVLGGMNVISPSQMAHTNHGEVGAYAWCILNIANSTVVPGSIYQGSDLRYSAQSTNSITSNSGNCVTHNYNVALSGTWRAMGGRTQTGTYTYPALLFARIS